MLFDCAQGMRLALGRLSSVSQAFTHGVEDWSQRGEDPPKDCGQDQARQERKHMNIGKLKAHDGDGVPSRCREFSHRMDNRQWNLQIGRSELEKGSARLRMPYRRFLQCLPQQRLDVGGGWNRTG